MILGCKGEPGNQTTASSDDGVDDHDSRARDRVRLYTHVGQVIQAGMANPSPPLPLPPPCRSARSVAAVSLTCPMRMRGPPRRSAPA